MCKGDAQRAQKRLEGRAKEGRHPSFALALACHSSFCLPCSMKECLSLFLRERFSFCDIAQSLFAARAPEKGNDRRFEVAAFLGIGDKLDFFGFGLIG